MASKPSEAAAIRDVVEEEGAAGVITDSVKSERGYGALYEDLTLLRCALSRARSWRRSWRLHYRSVIKGPSHMFYEVTRSI